MAVAVKCFWFAGSGWEARRVGERERREVSFVPGSGIVDGTDGV